MREFWDNSTEALYSDVCDLLAQHLKTAFEEKPPYVHFEGGPITSHNPGWLNAALVAMDLLGEPNKQIVSLNLKSVLKKIRDKTQTILNATKKIMDEKESYDDSLQSLVDLYDDIIYRIETYYL